MAILSDSAILAAIERGEIVVTPFDRESLGPNSYDICLGNTIAWYKQTWGEYACLQPLDPKNKPEVQTVQIPETGFVLYPGRLYLAATVEYTEAHKHVPYLDGKSSIARLGISVHATAGRGDVGFFGHWTMEIQVAHLVRVYAGMKIGQLTWHTVEGEVLRPYNKKPDAKYANQGPNPVESRMYINYLTSLNP